MARTRALLVTEEGYHAMTSKSSPARTQSAGSKLITPDAPFRQLLVEMGQRAELEKDEASGISDEMLSNILAAETETEILKAANQKPLGGRDIAGMRIQIVDFTVKYGAGEDADMKTKFISPGDGRQMYLWVTAVRLDDPDSWDAVEKQIEYGATFQFNTSAPILVATLWAFNRRGLLPAYGYVEATKARVGSVLRWHPVKDMPETVQGTVVDVQSGDPVENAGISDAVPF